MWLSRDAHAPELTVSARCLQQLQEWDRDCGEEREREGEREEESRGVEERREAMQWMRREGEEAKVRLGDSGTGGDGKRASDLGRHQQSSHTTQSQAVRRGRSRTVGRAQAPSCNGSRARQEECEGEGEGEGNTSTRQF